jgi:hypothetical protein
MPYKWGPNYIVPTEVIKVYSGQVMLREDYDDDLLLKELEDLGLKGSIFKVNNPWYFRKKDASSWIKIGESTNRTAGFAVRWNTAELPDGQYEILGMMHVVISKGDTQHTIASNNIVEVTVKNPPEKVLQWRPYPPQTN